MQQNLWTTMVLDTSVCVDLFRETNLNKQGNAYQALKELGDTRIYLTVFSLCELRTGACLSKLEEIENRKINSLSLRTTLLYPDDSFSVLYGETAAILIKAGTPIPVMDLMIGILAKAHGLPVLTRDIRHFKKIPGLVVESY